MTPHFQHSIHYIKEPHQTMLMYNDEVFSGFPSETFDFLHDLKQNNRRDWFESNRDSFEEYIYAPAKAFIRCFGERARSIYPNLIHDDRGNGSGSLLRLRRDIRFAEDKTPYKTFLDMRFWLSEAERTAGNARLYVHLDGNGVRISGGERYVMPRRELHKLRTAIDQDDSGQLRQILMELESAGFELNADKFKRTPRDFPQDHVNTELLKLKNLSASSPLISPGFAAQPAMLDQLFFYAERLNPLNAWLERALA
jgi:uncharacterized protein (TIGR02453 family)